MSDSLKGFCTTLLRNPPRIQVRWDRITQPDFEEVEIVWWYIGSPVIQNAAPIRNLSQFSHIPARPGKTYVVAARAHFTFAGIEEHYLTRWAYEVVEVPQAEDKPQYTNLGQVTVIDTPRGPAILLDELREVCGQ